MNASKQRPEGVGGAAPTAAAASSSNSSSISSLSSACFPPSFAPPLSGHEHLWSGFNPADELEMSDHRKKGQWVAAIELLNRRIARVGDSAFAAEWTIERAHCHFRLDEYNAALRDCDSVLSFNSRDWSTHELRFKCLLGLRRYAEAERALKQLAQSATSSTRHVQSMQSLWDRIQLERTGVFDQSAIGLESLRLSIVSPTSHTAQLSKMHQQREYPVARLGPHADYLHPSVECAVAIAGKGRGTRVRANATSAADSSASSSSASSSSSAASSAAQAYASSTGSGSLPKHSLVMSMKAISVGLRSDDRLRSSMLLRKLKDQPELFEQVRRLFRGSSHEAERTQLLLSTTVESAWLRPPVQPSTAASLSADQLLSSLSAVMDCNAFGDSTDEYLSCLDGSALFFLPSFFNHSCVPNCNWRLIGDQMFIRTVRDVDAGEELTIAYAPTTALQFEARQAKLFLSWGFSCSCASCALYMAHPALRLRESRFRASCERIGVSFAQSESSYSARDAKGPSRSSVRYNRSVELLRLHARLQSLISGYRGALKLLQRHSALCLTPAHLVLVPQLRLASSILRSVLLGLGAADVRLPTLLAQHSASCLDCAALAESCCVLSNEEWLVAHLDRLELQSRFPAAATVTADAQVAAMRSVLSEYMRAHGDANTAPFETERGDEINRAGLDSCYEQAKKQLMETPQQQAEATASMEDA